MEVTRGITLEKSYSWPSFGDNFDRLENVEIYARQIKPVLQFLIEFGFEGIKTPNDFETSELNNALYFSQNPLVLANLIDAESQQSSPKTY